MSEKTSPEKTLSVDVEFNVPVGRVWAAFADPKLFAKWQSLDEAPVTTVSHDFKPGGKWKYTMPMPNGYDYVAEGTYAVIEPFQRIEMTATTEFVGELCEWIFLFEGNDNHTHITFSCVFQTEAYTKRQSEEMSFHRRWKNDFAKLRRTLV